MARKGTSGILVEVYRSNGRQKDPIGLKLTDRHDTLVLILPEGGPFEPDEKTPGVELEDRSRKRGNETIHLMAQRSGGKYLNVVEIDKPHGPGSTAYGGAFIFTSDSRFPSDYPIAVHDMNPCP